MNLLRGETTMLPSRTPGAAEPGAPAAVAPVAVSLGPNLRVEVIRDPEALDAIEPDWNELLRTSDATVFQSFEWQRTWWRHFGERRRGAGLHLVTVRDGSTLVAVAPLWIDRSRLLGLAPVRRLRWIGCGDSDYLDVLAARGREEWSVERVADALAGDAGLFDVAVLEDTSDRSRTGPLLGHALGRHGWTVSRVAAEPCPETALLGSWEETIAAFRIHHRREIRRRLRNIERGHRIELEVVSRPEEVAPAILEFMELHQQRWERDGYWGAFSDPGVLEFHRDVAARLAARGWLFLAFLRVDGQRCAGNYGFSFGDAVATFQSAVGHDPELTPLSPGRVLHALSMQWAIARGRTRYDFMRGAEPYKYELDAVDVPNWTTVAYPRAARRAAAGDVLIRAQAALLRRSRREARALRAAARSEGWLSGAVLAHLTAVARRTAADARRLARPGPARSSPGERSPTPLRQDREERS
jgi:CelD/BcsL family acetyltransferase involved in cellulose biosynthesis